MSFIAHKQKHTYHMSREMVLGCHSMDPSPGKLTPTTLGNLVTAPAARELHKIPSR